MPQCLSATQNSKARQAPNLAMLIRSLKRQPCQQGSHELFSGSSSPKPGSKPALPGIQGRGQDGDLPILPYLPLISPLESSRSNHRSPSQQGSTCNINVAYDFLPGFALPALALVIKVLPPQPSRFLNSSIDSHLQLHRELTSKLKCRYVIRPPSLAVIVPTFTTTVVLVFLALIILWSNAFRDETTS
jgi:hypothetical protein